MLQHPARSAFILVGMLAAVVAQPEAGQRQTRPAERGADLVSIQFAAVDEDGTPITDVRAEEVRIRIGGRDRAVRSLQLITFESGGDLDVPPPFGTNAQTNDGRTFVVAIDEDSFRPGREGPLRAAVEGLLARLGANDAVALVTMPYGGVKVPFTTDHARVKLAMSSIVGHAPSNETATDLACRTGRTLEALAAFLDQMGVREETATMLFVTSALAPPRSTAITNMRLSSEPAGPGMCDLRPDLFGRVATAAGAARTRFYVIRPPEASNKDASQANLGSESPLAGIEHLAGVTGGKLLALTGGAGTAMDRVARETAAYYVASVDSQRNDYSGRSQQLEVRVSRRGVEVRSTPHITLVNDPASARFATPSIRDMMGTTRVFRNLPLRAAGFSTLGGARDLVRVIIIAEPGEPGVKLESAAGGLFNDEGRLVGQWSASAEELQRPTVMGAIDVPRGGYRLRVAAIDATGRAGTADYDVSAEAVSTGPLKLSSLVIGLSRQGGFVPKLQFGAEPLAVAYVELEGAAAGAKVNAALEIAQTLNGRAVVTVPLAIDGTADNRYRAMGSVPLGALPPGDYVARAVIGLEGHPLTRVVRTFRKVAPAAQ